MVRNMILIGSLFLGIAIAIGWAVAPICLGGVCLGADAQREGKLGASAIDQEAQTNWADADAANATADAPGQNSELISGDPLAQADDPSHEAGQDNAGFETSDRDGSAAGGYEEGSSNKAQKPRSEWTWEDLTDAALNEPDDELRSEAINAVALQRSTDSVFVLTEVAYFDVAPGHRLQAIQQLWYSAADGLDHDGEIHRTLEAGLTDPDKEVAFLAAQAIADLQALEEAKGFD